MKTIAACLLSLLIPVSILAAGPTSYKVVYRGGSFPNIKKGTELSLFIDATTVKLMKGKKQQVAEIPASAITEVSYGRDIHRRVGEGIGLALVNPFGIGALAAFTKEKKH